MHARLAILAVAGLTACAATPEEIAARPARAVHRVRLCRRHRRLRGLPLALMQAEAQRNCPGTRLECDARPTCTAWMRSAGAESPGTAGNPIYTQPCGSGIVVCYIP